jgi:hypothetical protein
LRKPFYILFLLLAASIIPAGNSYAQLVTIRGTVYDSSRNYPLEAVTVMSTSGAGTVTNQDGFYEINVQEKDSVWFSYLNKPTIKFPVLKIVNTLSFDISLQVSTPTLREVKVMPRNYKLDSLRNRQDYAKIFNYQKPGLRTVTPQYGVGMGFDLDEIINMFRFRRNRSLASFQQRLLIEEQEKFIDHRFNKALVRRLTLLESPLLDSFMQLYRPSYTFTKYAGDYDFQYYIKTAFFRYKHGIRPDDE